MNGIVDQNNDDLMTRLHLQKIKETTKPEEKANLEQKVLFVCDLAEKPVHLYMKVQETPETAIRELLAYYETHDIGKAYLHAVQRRIPDFRHGYDLMERLISRLSIDPAYDPLPPYHKEPAFESKVWAQKKKDLADAFDIVIGSWVQMHNADKQFTGLKIIQTWEVKLELIR